MPWGAREGQQAKPRAAFGEPPAPFGSLEVLKPRAVEDQGRPRSPEPPRRAPLHAAAARTLASCQLCSPIGRPSTEADYPSAVGKWEGPFVVRYLGGTFGDVSFARTRKGLLIADWLIVVYMLQAGLRRLSLGSGFSESLLVRRRAITLVHRLPYKECSIRHYSAPGSASI